MFPLQLAAAGMGPSSCVWVHSSRTDGLVSVYRPPERPQPWYEALWEANPTGQLWHGANPRAGHGTRSHGSNTSRQWSEAAQGEAFMPKTLVLLVAAFNLSTYTKPFLYENSLNYHHLKMGLPQASLIRISVSFSANVGGR